MLKAFYPDEYKKSVYSLDFKQYYKQGYRAILFDIDNTLVPHGAGHEERSLALFRTLDEIGFSCCLISNNKDYRVKPFADEIKIQYICNAKKPSRKNYRKAMGILGSDTTNTLFIGDQLFTDVYGAKRAGIHSILVEPMDPREEIQIVLKRYLERIVLWSYKRRT